MRIALQNFTGGEVAPTLSARYDLARYRNCVSCMENMLPGLHGDVARRPGTRYLAELDGPAVLLPFSFSADAGQNFALILSHKSLRVADANGLVPGLEPLATPYATADLLEISHAQVGDVVYLAHRRHPLHKLIRSDAPAGGYAWHLQPVALNTSLAAPAAPTVSFQGTAGSYSLRYKVAAVDANGRSPCPRRRVWSARADTLRTGYRATARLSAGRLWKVL